MHWKSLTSAAVWNQKVQRQSKFQSWFSIYELFQSYAKSWNMKNQFSLALFTRSFKWKAFNENTLNSSWYSGCSLNQLSFKRAPQKVLIDHLRDETETLG